MKTLHDDYLHYLHDRVTDIMVREFIRDHPKMQRCNLFTGFRETDRHLKMFVRILIDNRDILVPFFQGVLDASDYSSSSSGTTFRFMLPSASEVKCNPYYVSLSPLGVLYFLFAWMKHYRPDLTEQYIYETEYKCIRASINACRHSPDVLLRATALLNQKPGADICETIEAASDQDTPVTVTQISLVGGRRRS